MSLPGEPPSGDTPPDDPRLRELSQRLDQARAPAGDPAARAQNEAMSQGWRLSMELVLAPLVGGAMGWLIDKGLGTRPFGLLIFLAFGAIAGFVNVVRTARQLNAREETKDHRNGGGT